MASSIVRVNDLIRTIDQSYFSSHTGIVYVQVKASENGAVEEWHIWAASPTATNFNDAPVGSYLYDTAAPATIKRQTSAGTWETLTFS